MHRRYSRYISISQEIYNISNSERLNLGSNLINRRVLLRGSASFEAERSQWFAHKHNLEAPLHCLGNSESPGLHRHATQDNATHLKIIAKRGRSSRYSRNGTGLAVFRRREEQADERTFIQGKPGIAGV